MLHLNTARHDYDQTVSTCLVRDFDGELTELQWFSLDQLEQIPAQRLCVTSLEICRRAFVLVEQWQSFPASAYNISNP